MKKDSLKHTCIVNDLLYLLQEKMMQEEAKLKAKYPNVKPGGPSGLLAKRLQRGVSLFPIQSYCTIYFYDFRQEKIEALAIGCVGVINCI